MFHKSNVKQTAFTFVLQKVPTETTSLDKLVQANEKATLAAYLHIALTEGA